MDDPETPSPASSSWTTVRDSPECDTEHHGIFAEEIMHRSRTMYQPILSTVRLYAGWLLAWYVVLYALASYQLTRNLPIHVAFLEDIVRAPALADICFGLFLVLMLSSMHRLTRGGALRGVLLILGGLIVWLLFVVNMR